jgi:hypothetical protein
MTKYYQIPCTWSVYGVCEVKAENLSEAIDIAYADSTPLPLDTEDYLEDSFVVDMDGLKERYPEEVDY